MLTHMLLPNLAVALNKAALRTAAPTCPIMVISASSASSPDWLRRCCGGSSWMSPASVNPGWLLSAAARPRSRSAAGARATPSAVPLEFVGTAAPAETGCVSCPLLPRRQLAKSIRTLFARTMVSCAVVIGSGAAVLGAVSGILSDESVDRLPDQVGMTYVACILLNRVHQEPSQAGCPAVGPGE